MGVACSSDYGDVWCGVRGDVRVLVVVGVVGVGELVVCVWEGCVGVLCWVWLVLWLGEDGSVVGVAGCSR